MDDDCYIPWHEREVPKCTRLAKCNAGAIAYPMIVGISIAIFMIYTSIRLKEKLSFPALCGVLLCLAGIVVIAL